MSHSFANDLGLFGRQQRLVHLVRQQHFVTNGLAVYFGLCSQMMTLRRGLPGWMTCLRWWLGGSAGWSRGVMPVTWCWG